LSHSKGLRGGRGQTTGRNEKRAGKEDLRSGLVNVISYYVANHRVDEGRESQNKSKTN